MNGGKFVIIVGPSASGKTTIVEEAMKRLDSGARLVTTTTRSLRDGEKDGVDYHFISRDEFEQRRDRGEFLEWNEFNGNLYGSSRVVIENMMKEHKAVFANLDVNGARRAMQVFPEALTIFIRPESLTQLSKRLHTRGTKEEEIEWRLEHAREELTHADLFGHIVTNKENGLDGTVTEVVSIIESEQE